MFKEWNLQSLEEKKHNAVVSSEPFYLLVMKIWKAATEYVHRFDLIKVHCFALLNIREEEQHII